MSIQSDFLAGHALVLLLQSAIVLAIGLLAARVMKFKGPAWTTMIFRATLASAFFVVAVASLLQPSTHPIVSVSAPPIGPKLSWPIQVAPAVKSRTIMPVASEPQSRGVQPPEVQVPRLAESSLTSSALPEQSKTLSLRDGLLVVWLTGTIALLGWIVVGQVWLWNRRRSATTPVPAEMGAVLRILSTRQGLKTPDLVVCLDAKSAFLAGILHPAIYIPSSTLSQFDDEQIEAILSHELIHIRHKDCLWNLVAKLFCAVTWPNPLSWVVARQMKLASEELCDQAVIQLGLHPKSYARCLLRVAELTSGTRTERYVGVGVTEFKSSLARRVELVLQSSKMVRLSRAAKFVTASALTIVAVTTCLLVSAHRPAAAALKSSTTAEGVLPKTDPAAEDYLSQCYAAYANLNSYSARVVSGIGPFQSTTYDISFKRPDQVLITLYQQHRLTPEAQILGEKDQFFVTSPDHPKSYVVHQRPPAGSPLKRTQFPWYLKNSSLQAALQACFIQAGTAEFALTLPPNLKRMNAAPSVTFGVSENPSDKLLLLRYGGMNGQTQTTALEINDSDHLIRKETMTIKFPHTDDYVTTESYSDVKVDPALGTIKFTPPDNWKRIVAQDGRPERSETSQNLTSELVDTLKNAHSISFVDDEIEEQERPDKNGRPEPHNQHMRMTVAIEKPLKAHFKLTLDEYPNEGLELIADGTNVYVLHGRSPNTYLKMPATGNDIARFGNMGIPVNACSAGMDALLAALPSQVGGMFDGDIGKPTVFQGEPVDQLVRTQFGHDRYGFPAKGGGQRIVLLSQKDHTIRQVTQTMGGSPGKAQLVEKFSNFKLDAPIPDTEFQFDPAGMSPVDQPNQVDTHRPEIGLNMNLGDYPPDFHSTDFSGNPISLDQFKGKVVLLYGWTMGIGNYQWDLPRFQQLFEKYGKKGLVVIGIPYDGVGDKPQMLQFLRSHGITTPQVFDGLGRKAGIQKLYKTYETMFNYVIGRDGRLYAKDAWDKEVDKAVAEALAK